ncbi:uncharacterized protein BXIN_2138 [Babesia sp. Xinjiang]|uniref:uncharacterized protein n=1 Tax=Babesia sp. Xinjiang TaxID=462227 RepID=UPI000A22DFB3|nr:uncharacterized protein BXIN_2138 [Babesia sp. Xinjiang]ORM40527.1 hypothetical protein BXIN_2138 [Babesia sp. Xinjiang]
MHINPICIVLILCTITSLPTYADKNAGQKPAEGSVKKSQDEATGKNTGKTLLSRLYGPVSFKRMRRSFDTYSCTVPPLIKLDSPSPVVTINGRLNSLTAVLVGYGSREVSELFRSNKGYIYGVGNAWKNKNKYIHQVGLTVDYAPPENPRWKAEEFCMLIFSPSLKVGKSLRSLIGKRYNHKNRYLGSTENIVNTLIDESEGTSSKMVTQCCFIMHK